MATVAFVYHPDYLKHETGEHPERPERAAAIARSVDRAALPLVELVAPGPASPEQVLRVHSPQHVDRVRRACASGWGRTDPDTAVCRESFDVALLAAGGAIRAVESVLTGECRSAFAAVRPPGHHASPGSSGGFCLLNNVAVAGRHAQCKFGLSRVLIVDFDAHHGNGTQATFDDDPRVLYTSIHEYPMYPGTGALWDVGRGTGRGYTVNVPVPAGAGDAAYQRLFDDVLAPVAHRFRPELILVSAGYDAHWTDPLVLLEVSVAGFARMVARLRSWADDLCGGRLALVLEGGYDLEALSASVLASLAVLAEVEPVDPLGPSPRASAVDVEPVIEEIRRVHRRWLE